MTYSGFKTPNYVYKDKLPGVNILNSINDYVYGVLVGFSDCINDLRAFFFGVFCVRGLMACSVKTAALSKLRSVRRRAVPAHSFLSSHAACDVTVVTVVVGSFALVFTAALDVRVWTPPRCVWTATGKPREFE